MDDRLRKFAAVIDAGSFTTAAAALHISQPALSAAVHKLERELQALLLVRGIRPLQLTPAGEQAYATAKELAVSTDNLRLRLAELAQAGIRLRIGMIDSIAATMFAGATAMTDFGRQVQVSVMVNNSRFLLGAVERDAVDIALVACQPGPVAPLLAVRRLADEPLVMVCHRSFARLVQRQLRGHTLDRFISYDQQSNTYRLVQEDLQRRGIIAHTGFYSTSPEVMLRLVLLQQQGTAVLPYHMVSPYVASATERVIKSGLTNQE